MGFAAERLGDFSDLGITVRLGSPRDAAGILSCLVSTLSERAWFDRDESEMGSIKPYVLGDKIRDFQPGERAYLVAVQGNKVIGFILIVRGHLKSTKHAADFGMAILPGFRDRGIGSMLVQSAIDWCEEHEVEKLYCCTFDNNQRAIKLYEKFDFIREGERKKQYKINGKYVGQILFGKILG